MHINNLQHTVSKRLCVWTLLIALVFHGSPALGNPSPLEVVKSGTNQVMGILRGSCQPGETYIVGPHRDELFKIVNQYFDFGEMAMRSLGHHWKTQPPAKQEQFVRLFRELIFNSYIKRYEYCSRSDEQILYDTQSLENKYAVVKTRVTGYKGAEFPMDYRLILKQNEWKVYDVVIEGISLVNNYRQQFNSILTNESFDDLLNRIRSKL